MKNPLKSNATLEAAGPMKFVQTSTMLMFPIVIITQYLNMFLSSGHITKYLDGWTIFEEKFKTMFNHHKINSKGIFPKTTVFLRFAWIFLACQSILLGLILYPMIQSTNNNEKLSSASKIMRIHPMVEFCFLSILVQIVIDLLSNLMMNVNTEAFFQVKL